MTRSIRLALLNIATGVAVLVSAALVLSPAFAGF